MRDAGTAFISRGDNLLIHECALIKPASHRIAGHTLMQQQDGPHCIPTDPHYDTMTG